jgi:hypothetical protein
MSETVSYEMRIIEGSKVIRQFASNLVELFSLLEGVVHKPFYIFRIYKSSNGSVLRSERLTCAAKKGGFVIKTVKEKTFTHKEEPTRPTFYTPPKKKISESEDIVEQISHELYPPHRFIPNKVGTLRDSAISKPTTVMRTPGTSGEEGVFRGPEEVAKLGTFRDSNKPALSRSTKIGEEIRMPRRGGSNSGAEVRRVAQEVPGRRSPRLKERR